MKNEIITVISGDNTYTDAVEFRAFCDRVLSKFTKVTIVTGDEAGTETLAQQYAANRGYELKLIDEDVLDRHKELLIQGDTLISFWNGVNIDTKMLIDRAFWTDKRIKVLGYED